MFLLQIALIVGAATLLAVWCGWGLARLTLPEALRPWSGLLALLMGYALVLVVGYVVTRNLGGMPVALAIIIPAAGALNALAWVRTGRPHIERAPRAYLTRLPLAAVVIVTLIVGVLPLLSYNYPAIIGGGWDFEVYLPPTRYLERGPISAIASYPTNPLRDINAQPAANGVTIAFSIYQACVDVLTGQEALVSFAPLLAWLRALGIVGVYVLFRATFGMGRWGALLGAALTSAGALLLWASYFNFAMQMSAWPLIPLGLVLATGAVADAERRGARAWPSVVGAAIALAAAPVAYYPAVTFLIPALAGLGLAMLVYPAAGPDGAGRARIRQVAAWVALGIITLLLSALPNLDALQYYNPGVAPGGRLGLADYVSITDILGLTTFIFGQPVPTTIKPEVLALLALMLGLMLAGLILVRREYRARWLGLLSMLAIYMVWLQWIQHYPYGWLKIGTYSAFALLGLAAAGIESVALRLRQRSAALAGAWAVVIPLLLLVPMVLSQARIVTDHLGQPHLLAAELPALSHLREEVPPGSTVRINDDTRIEGVTNGLLAYLLDHTTVIGKASTGYVPHWSAGEPDQVADYTLLLYDEDPAAWGLSQADRIWAAEPFVLYKRPPNVQESSHLDITLQPGKHLSAPAQGPVMDLQLLSFEPSSVQVAGKTYSLPAGAASLALDARAPGASQLVNNGPSPLIVHSGTVVGPADGSEQQVDSVRPLPGAAFATAQVQATEARITSTLDVYLPEIRPATLAVDVWDRIKGLHYGFYSIKGLPVNAHTTVTLALDPSTGKLEGQASSGGSPVAIQIDSPTVARLPGDYDASLYLLSGTRSMAAPVPLFSFSVPGAGPEIVKARSSVGAPLAAVATDRPPFPLDPPVMFGSDTQLLGYDLASSTAYPGREVALTLWWRPLAGNLDERSVMLHLRDGAGGKRAQADGTPAGGGYPTSVWQMGDIVVDRHVLTLPRDLPPGEYNLAIGMYHYPSTEMLPASAGGQPVQGDTLLVPLHVASR